MPINSIEVSVSKQESKKSKFHEQFPKNKKHSKKINLVTIKTASSYPIQEVMCREEHKNLFEDLWGSPS